MILGLLLAALALVIVLNIAGNPLESSSYCSKYGIGPLDTAPVAVGKDIVHINGEWTDFPPARRCRVYALEGTGSGQPGSAEEMLAAAPLPHFVIAEGSYPGTAEYAWILGALLLLIWCVLTLLQSRVGTARPRR